MGVYYELQRNVETIGVYPLFDYIIGCWCYYQLCKMVDQWYQEPFEESEYMVMRAYFFCNMYLSSIQKGIQSAHVVHEMFNEYVAFKNSKEYNTLIEWSCHYKTMILLNGGESVELKQLVENFADDSNEYPYSYFTESEDALNGATTCVGIVIPEKIYTVDTLTTNPMSNFEYDLRKYIQSCSLAI